ncbi:hypothetical protein M9458_023743, partial [Cirrhinus mrigala]
ACGLSDPVHIESLQEKAQVALTESAAALRPTPAATARSESRSRQPHLSALLHAAGWQDANRDAYPGYAAFWKLHQLAVRARTVDEQSED